MRIRTKLTVVNVALVTILLGALGLVSIQRIRTTTREIVNEGINDTAQMARRLVELSLSARRREIEIATNTVEGVARTLVVDDARSFSVTVYHQATGAASEIVVPWIGAEGVLLSESGLAAGVSADTPATAATAATGAAGAGTAGGGTTCECPDQIRKLRGYPSPLRIHKISSILNQYDSYDVH